MTKRATLKELDGLNIKDAKRMPHPVELSRWSDAGLYYIDSRGIDPVFRLTEKGKTKAERKW